MNRKDVLKRLPEKKADRGPVTVYLSKSLFKSFQKACGEHSASAVLEHLIQDFIQSRAK